MFSIGIVPILVVILLNNNVLAESCDQKSVEYGYVCVCTEKYCDTVPKIDVQPGKYQQFITSSEKLGFNTISGDIKSEEVGSSKFKINLLESSEKQSVFGFGGAFTGSTAFNIKNLPENAQNNLLNSFFGEDGIQYSMCRVPIGGTDFSLKYFTYAEVEGDIDLKHFALQEEDLDYKIPIILRAKELTNNTVRFIASAWTAPPWMKTNADYNGIGFLKAEYYQSWANYYVKFFEAYAEKNINFWGVTTQNEPSDGFLPKFISKINSMGFSTSQMNNFLGDYFGPTIRSSTFKDLKIIIHDDRRQTLPILPKILENKKSMQYADGVGIHWYKILFPSSFIEKYTKSSLKDLFLIGTEACNGWLSILKIEKPVELGSWYRAEKYVKDIIQDMFYGATGWIDWNMVLDQTGGPCVIKNKVDAAIIANNSTGEFYKQPMFYAMGHFSKFLRPNSTVLEVQNEEKNPIKSVSVLRPDGLHAVVIFNEGETSTTADITSTKGSMTVNIKEKSINTILF